MNDTVNLNIPKEADERAVRNVVNDLLVRYRSGEFNNDQMVLSIQMVFSILHLISAVQSSKD